MCTSGCAQISSTHTHVHQQHPTTMLSCLILMSAWACNTKMDGYFLYIVLQHFINSSENYIYIVLIAKICLTETQHKEAHAPTNIYIYMCTSTYIYMNWSIHTSCLAMSTMKATSSGDFSLAALRLRWVGRSLLHCETAKRDAKGMKKGLPCGHLVFLWTVGKKSCISNFRWFQWIKGRQHVSAFVEHMAWDQWKTAWSPWMSDFNNQT